MKRLIMTAAGLALLTGLAIAQEQPPAPPPGPAPAPMADTLDAPPPPPGPGPRDRHGPHGREGERAPPPPPSKAAHFRVEKGDMKLDVKCADDEAMQACADIALKLIDKVGVSAPRP